MLQVNPIWYIVQRIDLTQVILKRIAISLSRPAALASLLAAYRT